MIAGYILTGGKNRRMNGQKKLFLTYQGKTFYDCICSAFQDLPEIYLSVDATEPFSKFHRPMILDMYPQTGPIGGICSGLLQCPEDALFVTACDMPLIDAKSVQKIYAVYRQHPEKITVASYQGYRQPLFGIYPKSVGPLLEQMIAEGRYRMKDLLTMAEAVEVPFEENDKIMININTPAEYQQLKGGETVCFNWKKPETY